MTGKEHLKRVAAPRTWPITRKTSKWVAKPSPGPHSEERGMPLVIVLRDLLHIADKSREIKHILHEGKVLVDGKVRKDHRFPVGLFDVISIPEIKASYRVMIGSDGKFKLVPVSDSTLKLLKIVDKTMVTGGKIQLNFHDGTTMLASNDYHTKDTLIMKVPEKSIDQHLKYEVGSLAVVVGGKHASTVGKIKDIRIIKSTTPNRITITGPEGDFTTVEKYVVVIGKDTPAIDLVGVKA
jgi:small subunit ribosomal protein S4e